MILYSSSTCPKCKVLKMKLDQANVNYQVEEDLTKLAEKGIKTIPYLELDDGNLIDFGEAVKLCRVLKEENDEIKVKGE